MESRALTPIVAMVTKLCRAIVRRFWIIRRIAPSSVPIAPGGCYVRPFPSLPGEVP